VNLLVDIGNARIKWALQDADTWKVGEPLQRLHRAFKDIARPAWKDLDAPERVFVSNVAGEDYRKSVQTWIRRRWKVTPEFLPVTERQCGVTNAYSVPQRLGADRWASLLAVHAHYKGPAVVIDCGTAITIDAISADGTHLGGLIVPGMELMINALTVHVPGIQIDDTENQDISLLGRSTEAAVTGGVLYTAIALVERVFMDLQGELGARTNLLLTGGDAARILPLLGRRPEYVPDLVLKGLAVYAEETAECVT